MLYDTDISYHDWNVEKQKLLNEVQKVNEKTNEI